MYKLVKTIFRPHAEGHLNTEKKSYIASVQEQSGINEDFKMFLVLIISYFISVSYIGQLPDGGVEMFDIAILSRGFPPNYL